MHTNTCAPSADAPTSPLSSALRGLAAAKEAEKLATARRLEAEELVLLLAGDLPAETTVKLEADGLKATIRTSMRRTVDPDILATIGPLIPTEIGKRVIRWKPDVDLRELRYLQNNEPEIYATLAQAITAKPAKPSVTIEEA